MLTHCFFLSSARLGRGDFFDRNGGVLGAGSLGAHGVLAPAVAEYPDLLALGLSQDLAGHFSSLGLALLDAELAVVLQHDHFTEFDRIASLTLEAVDSNDIALGNAVLLSSGL